MIIQRIKSISAAINKPVTTTDPAPLGATVEFNPHAASELGEYFGADQQVKTGIYIGGNHVLIKKSLYPMKKFIRVVAPPTAATRKRAEQYAAALVRKRSRQSEEWDRQQDLSQQATKYAAGLVKFINKLGFTRDKFHRDTFRITVANKVKAIKTYQALEKQLKADGYTIKPQMQGLLIAQPGDEAKPKLTLTSSYNDDESLTLGIFSGIFTQLP